MEPVMHTFDRFFFLAIISTGEVPSFVKSSIVIPHSKLHKKFNSGGARGLTCG